MTDHKLKRGINRRSFLRSGAVTGAGIILSPMFTAKSGAAKNSDDLNVALVGAGAQGQVLLNACLKIPNIRFRAVCDIWVQHNQKRACNLLKAYKHDANAYVDYREMLDKESGLDAVIVATPDFWHAEHTVGCLKAGLHVYCEKEMSNTLEGARKMVQAQKETGKLLQIGHQRRSNPRYIYCFEKLIRQTKILGRITTVNGQWNRSARPDLTWPQKATIDQGTLEKYGFESMHQFRNWRWYKKLGGGPIVDLGSHQIDIFNWFLDTVPKSVMASGGTDYYDKKNHQWYDNVMAIYEYEVGQRTIRAFYQTITTNSSQGHFEKFMGSEGTLIVSEASGTSAIYREEWVPAMKWDEWVKKGYLNKTEATPHSSDDDSSLEVRASVLPTIYDFPVKTDKPYHQLHLENFFNAIRGKAKLNCPAEIGYKSAVTVLKVNEAVAAGGKLNFKPEDFKV